MRKTAPIAALTLILILFTVGTAQTSPNSIRTSASPAASKVLSPEETTATLIKDVRELRELLQATRTERDQAVAALETEKLYSQSADRSYAAAEREIATLNRAIDRYEKAIALNEKTIALVETQRDDAKKEAKRSRKIATIAVLANLAQIAARIFF